MIKERDSKGRILRKYIPIFKICICGNTFIVTEDRIASGRGMYCSKPCSYKYRKVQKGLTHYKWSGDNPKYSALHKWMAKTFGQDMTCEWCGFETDNKYQIHWACITGIYNRDLKNWARLCAKCHYHHDREKT